MLYLQVKGNFFAQERGLEGGEEGKKMERGEDEEGDDGFEGGQDDDDGGQGGQGDDDGGQGGQGEVEEDGVNVAEDESCEKKRRPEMKATRSKKPFYYMVF